MKYEVFLSTDAERDVLDICSFLEDKVTSVRTDDLFDGLKNTLLSLEEFPERGHYTPELEKIHVRDYREIHFRIYRIIYRIIGQNIYIHAVLDGRRNLADILFERIIRNA